MGLLDREEEHQDHRAFLKFLNEAQREFGVYIVAESMPLDRVGRDWHLSTYETKNEHATARRACPTCHGSGRLPEDHDLAVGPKHKCQSCGGCGRV